MEIALQTYLDSVKAICPKITEGELAYYKTILTTTTLKAKEFYFQENQVQNQIGFIYQGLIRAYYIDSQGNEKTTHFVKENEYATDYPAFLTQMPSKYAFQCLEPSVIINLSYEKMQSGYEKYPILERYGRLMAEEVLKIQQSRIESFLFENAEERYLRFISLNPTLFNRVSLSHLSSCLGIERPSLSRIRKKLASK